jgi:hypothetical protein
VAAKTAKTALAAARAIRASHAAAGRRIVSLLLLLLLVLHGRLIRRLFSFRPGAHALGLESKVVFCPYCSVDHGVERLVGDAARHHAAYFWA